MSKLHYCDDGISVTDKVLSFQSTRSNEDYKKISKYYDNYKDRWFIELEEFLDRTTFDAEFDFKLCRAVESFDYHQAKALCEKYKWSLLGAFNRWFYAVLRNWKSNVKTSAFRQKKRPSIQCPVCGRHVSKIDEAHLSHFKSKGDLPKAFVWKHEIYQTMVAPEMFVNSWGSYTLEKLNNINNGILKDYQKTRVKWPWFGPKGDKKVICPFTKKKLSEITNEYIRSLPKPHSRYARSLSWQDFIEEYSYSQLIQADTYSLDYNAVDENLSLHGSIAVGNPVAVIKHEDVLNKTSNIEYEHVFYLIEKHITNVLDQKVLKLSAIGYSEDDIAAVLSIDKKEVRQRKKSIRSIGSGLKEKLLESV